MDKVSTITGLAAPLMRSNLDTDIIIRIERLTQLGREQLGPFAFEALRYHPDGSENPDFVLNQAPFRCASIIIAGTNFGCGSSREAAVWALMSAGIRCVIADSFGDIFYTNCFQNGLLPVILPKESVAQLAAQAASAATGTIALDAGAAATADATISVDLVRQEVRAANAVMPFAIEAIRRDALLEGLDEIGKTLTYRAAIEAWQQADRSARSWIWDSVG